MDDLQIKDYFDDYQVGEILVSPARTIIEPDVKMYAALTGQEDFAATAHGTQSVLQALFFNIGLALPFRLGQNIAAPKSFIAFYGIPSVQFLKPCNIGDTIHTEAKVIELIEKDPSRGVIVSQARIINQKNETVLSFTSKTLAGRRPASEKK